MDSVQAIDNTSLLWDFNNQKFIAKENFIEDEIEAIFDNNNNKSYIKNNVALFIKLAIANSSITKDNIGSIIGGDINKIKVNTPVLKKLANYLISNGFSNWDYNYWFDESLRNFNIWRFNQNNLHILCSKKDISLQGLYNNPGFKPGFKDRYRSFNISVDDINMINLLFNNRKNPKFIIGIGNYDDSRVIDDDIDSSISSDSSSTKKSSTGVTRKQPLYVKDPDNYVKNDIDPKFLNKLITTSGWSAINLQDMISMKKGDINIYNLTSGSNVKSIPKQVYINLCYYLRVSGEFLNESTKINVKTKIPSYAKFSVDNPWIMKQTWRFMDKDVITSLSKAVQIPVWFFNNIDHNTVYVSDRIKKIIMRWLNKNYNKKYTDNDLFAYDEKKSESDKQEVQEVKVFEHESKFIDRYNSFISTEDNKVEDIKINDIEEKVVGVEKKSSIRSGMLDFLGMLEKLDTDTLKTIAKFSQAIVDNRESLEIIDKIKENVK